MTRPVIRGGATRAELRRRWYRTLEHVPVAYCAWHRRYADRNVVDRECGLLIEGYPSAGNTFAREALGYANPDLRAEARSPAHTDLRDRAEALHRDLAAVARARFDDVSAAGDGLAAGNAGS